MPNPFDGHNHPQAAGDADEMLMSWIDAIPQTEDMTGDFFTFKVTEADWELANEVAAHIVARIDEDPSVAEMFRGEALGALAFAYFADHHYEDDVWEWPCDFRDDPRVDPTDPSNDFHPEWPEHTLSRFRVGENTVRVGLQSDSNVAACADPDMAILSASMNNADIHVTGSIDDDESLITLYGGTPFEVANAIRWNPATGSLDAEAEVETENVTSEYAASLQEFLNDRMANYETRADYVEDLQVFHDERMTTHFWEDSAFPEAVPILALPDAPDFQSPDL